MSAANGNLRLNSGLNGERSYAGNHFQRVDSRAVRNEKCRSGTKTPAKAGKGGVERTKRGYEWWVRFLMKAARGERKSAYTVAAAFVSRGFSKPQNHPVMPQGTREKNPNNRWSKNIAGKLPRPFNCTPKHKAYWLPGRIFPLFFRSIHVPPSILSPCWSRLLPFVVMSKSTVYRISTVHFN